MDALRHHIPTSGSPILRQFLENLLESFPRVRQQLEFWHTSGVDTFEDWVAVFASRYPYVCAAINHPAGFGCSRSGCDREHLCFLCGQQRHGMFQSQCGAYYRLRGELNQLALKETHLNAAVRVVLYGESNLVTAELLKSVRTTFGNPSLPSNAWGKGTSSQPPPLTDQAFPPLGGEKKNTPITAQPVIGAEELPKSINREPYENLPDATDNNEPEEYPETRCKISSDSNENFQSFLVMALDVKHLIHESDATHARVFRGVLEGAFGLTKKVAVKLWAAGVAERKREQNKARLNQEHAALQVLENCKFVVKMHASVIEYRYSPTSERYIGIMMELCDVPLDQYIVGTKRELLTQRHLQCIVLQLLMAYEACHAMKVCHRDVKPENILLATEMFSLDPPVPHLRLCDFEYSRVFMDHSASSKPFSTKVGTFDQKNGRYWIAPEVDGTQQYGPAGMWS